MGSAYDISGRRVTPRTIAVNLGLMAGIALAVFTWIKIANLVTQSEPAVAPLSQQPGSIVWDDHVFSNRAQLAAWLGARHINVTIWLRQHPDAAKIIGVQQPPARAGTRAGARPNRTGTASPNKTPHKRAAASVDKARPAVEAGPSSGSTLHSIAVDLLFVLALLLGAFAFAPTWAWRRVLRRMPRSAEARIYPAAAALAILAGLAAGGLF